MLRLKKISLLHFKNYTNRTIQFDERITGICGRNGIGKTSLLDAIHYLCFTKSYFSRLDGNNILHGNNGFRIEGEIELLNKSEKAVCILREASKKEFYINDAMYDKFSQHIGHYPCVTIAPDDIRIITNGSEERRKFIDTLISQLDSDYLDYLIVYNKLLLQRNSLLRSFVETGKKDLSLLHVLNEQIIRPAKKIFSKRKEFLVSFLPLVKQLYADIAKQSENVNLNYNSELLHASFAELLKANEAKDISAMRTTSGIHKDDLEFDLNGQAFKNIASQGQRKSLLLALKLAEMEVLKKEKGFSPILLLDDVFEKLDEERIANLLEYVCVENEGQIFITDTNCRRLEQHLKPLQLLFQLIELK
jgi:DNA replication and repair protein RecF